MLKLCFARSPTQIATNAKPVPQMIDLALMASPAWTANRYGRLGSCPTHIPTLYLAVKPGIIVAGLGLLVLAGLPLLLFHWNRKPPAAIPWPSRRGLDDLRPDRNLGLDDVGELRRRVADDLHTQRGELLAHVGTRQNLGGLRMKLRNDRRRRPGRRKQPEPGCRIEAREALLGHGRQIWHRCRTLDRGD